ncbi:unnamed protein product [Cuscuta campestris]|uniref:RNase H type-1 domain-containing protein n=1 Tax=Cuscuta campestris TaxID=132261 RepID=A0A484KJ60_9ASTE|nr:unnamed protein product [Cuscuta campestris]
MATAVDLGRELVRRKIRLTYGGGNVGLQGAVASTVYTNGGIVRGFIPGGIPKTHKKKKGKTLRPATSRNSTFERLEDREEGQRKSAKLRVGQSVAHVSAFARLGEGREAEPARTQRSRSNQQEPARTRASRHEEEAESQPCGPVANWITISNDRVQQMEVKLEKLEKKVGEKNDQDKPLAGSPFTTRVHLTPFPRKRLGLEIQGQIRGNCTKRKKFTYLSTARQRESENLTQFLTRWKEEVDKVEEMDDNTILSLLLNGLRAGELYKEFYLKPPATYQEAYHTAWEFAEAETQLREKKEVEHGFKPKPVQIKKEEAPRSSRPRHHYDPVVRVVNTKECQEIRQASVNTPENPTGQPGRQCGELGKDYLQKAQKKSHQWIRRAAQGNDRDNDWRRDNRQRESQPTPDKEHIGMIFGGPEGGDSAAQRKNWVRSIYVEEVTADQARRKQARRESIVFTDRDLPATGEDHNDPLVITMDINGVDVARVLVDTGSSVNILDTPDLASLDRITPALRLSYRNSNEPGTSGLAKPGSSRNLTTMEVRLSCAYDSGPIQEHLGSNGFSSVGPTRINSVVEEEPNSTDKHFFKMLKAADTDLWPGSSKTSQLSAVARLLNIKSEHNLSERCYDTICQNIKDILPEDNSMAKKKGGHVSLDEVIIHTKTKKHDGKTWVDPEHAELQEATQNGLQVTDEEIWCSLVEGHNAKNRVPRVGDYEREMRKMNPSSKPLRSSTSSRSTAEISALKEQNQRLQEQIDSLTSNLSMTIQEELRKLYGGNLPRRGVTDLQVNKPTEQWWEMAVDGASGPKGYGGGIVFTTPQGFKIYHSLVFNFKLTNNEAEYEALAGGLRLAQALKISRVSIKSHSSLIVGQVTGNMEARERQMAQYKDLVFALLKGFEEFNIAQSMFQNLPG